MSKQSRNQVGQQQPEAAPGLRELGEERLLAERLRHRCRIDLFEGVTERNGRRQRARELILRHGLADVLCAKDREGRSRTYGQLFAAAYGEPLRRSEEA